MISLDEALATVDRVLEGRTVSCETLSIREAHGRILAEDRYSKLDLPPFHKSAMDGYAVLEGDVRDAYRVIETVPAGKVPAQKLAPGAAVRIMTGAPVPEGTGRVIMIEDTDGGHDTVRVWRHDDRPNICKKGEDIHAGDLVAPAGTTLDAMAIANVVSCGIASVSVRRRIRVAIIPTGDEIVEHFEDLTPGKIMDSNTPMLAALAHEHGLEIVSSIHVPDVMDELVNVIGRGAELADMLLLSGGVSAGDFDFVPEALQHAGFTIHFDSVAVQPGRPMTFAARDDCVALGMPGNPVSVFLSFHLYARRVAARLSGAPPPTRSFEVRLEKEFERKRGDRAGFLPCRINASGHAEVLAFHGSAHLLSLGMADGFLHIPQGMTSMPAGSTAGFYPLMPVRR